MLGLAGYASSDEEEEAPKVTHNVSAQCSHHEKNEITTNAQDIQAHLKSKGAAQDDTKGRFYINNWVILC